MNYLAHIYLARYSDEAMLGALLGDFVKPGADGQFSAVTQAEILIHRKVDTFTDSHPVVLAAKSLFDGPGRRYSGILLDVFYDHVLAQQWARYSELPLAEFIAGFYGTLRRHAAVLPPKLAELAPYMIEQDWLGSYHSYAGVDRAVRRMSTRLSKNGHLLREGLADLKANHAQLESGFHAFFPDLIAFVDSRRHAARPALAILL